jgi:DNA N-6-adenine-methyltransferase (Dam)
MMPPVTRLLTGAPLREATQKCVKCGRPMVARAFPGTPKRFCSTACRMKAHRLAKKLMRPNEFYTPPHIIEIARACMGGIDLDPASCALANETVKAATFYDTRRNGLKRPWFGRVWLNPPYGRFSAPFVAKVVEELKAGRISQALILLNVNHIANGWFNDAMQVEHLICLPRKRVKSFSERLERSPLCQGVRHHERDRRKSARHPYRGRACAARSSILDKAPPQQSRPALPHVWRQGSLFGEHPKAGLFLPGMRRDRQCN